MKSIKTDHTPHLAVFCSSLNSLDEIGSLHRALDIHRKFVQAGWKVTFYTNDITRKPLDIGFKAKVYSQWPYILPKKLNSLYQFLMPLLRFRSGRKADVILTLQAFSASSAINAGKLWGAKVVARCGMVYGESAETLKKTGNRTDRQMRCEKKIFLNADKCIIPTAELADWVVNNYKVNREKIVIGPNNVDIELFKPAAKVKKDIDVICVGRLVDKKRHDILLEALADTNYKIEIIGQGKMKQRLLNIADKASADIVLIDRVENDILPEHFNRSKIYVNIAAWEGHPKALIEAMSCGLACVGAKSPGIENQIIDGQTGLLVEPEPKQIRGAIERLLADDKLRENLGKNAREYAARHFSLDTVFEIYRQTCEGLIK
jgi:glycosyltransferase involved in cell wall biosynthesis